MSDSDHLFEVSGTGAIVAICLVFIVALAAAAYGCKAKADADARIGVECVRSGGTWAGTVCSR